jgi:hypothetical protein
MPIYSCGLSYICPGKGLCCLTFLLFYFTVVAQYTYFTLDGTAVIRLIAFQPVDYLLQFCSYAVYLFHTWNCIGSG